MNCGLTCDVGHMSADQILLNMFAKDENGCVGLKVTWFWGVPCENLTPLAGCAEIVTFEQALQQAVVDDGCGGMALGVYFMFPEGA